MVDKLLQPFITSLQETMEMMVGSSVTPVDPYLKGGSITPGNVCGVIGFAGAKVMGSVALFFPTDLTLKLFEAMTGEAASEVTHDVTDTVAELSNIVAGGGKTAYAQQGIRFDIAIPSVVMGESISISYGPGARVMVIPCEYEDSLFHMEIMLKPMSG